MGGANKQRAGEKGSGQFSWLRGREIEATPGEGGGKEWVTLQKSLDHAGSLGKKSRILILNRSGVKCTS